MRPELIIAITFVLLSTIFISPTFADLTEYKNTEFGFSIQYPENWIIDDEIIEFEPVPGFDEGFFSIVYFYDDPDVITDSIEVTFLKNDNIARNNQGQQYIDRVSARLIEN